MSARSSRHIRNIAWASAVLLALGSARAEEGDDSIRELTKPESSASAGVGYVNKDNQRFGQYSGLRKDQPYGLMDVDAVKRDDETGTWLKFSGRNLGLDNRELRFEHSRQGDWGYFIEYGETPRYNPLTVTTRLGAPGTTTQTLNAATGPYNLDLSTRRDAVGLGFDKIFVGGISLQVRFKNEEKTGSRMYGQGTNGTINFLIDPINQVTRQLDLTLAYAGEKAQLSGGYYGTMFQNRNEFLTVVGGIAGQSPIALPPDNRSHQLNLTGGYNFTNTTRGNFKISYSRMIQDETFILSSPLSGRSNLGGLVEDKMVQGGFTAQPLPKLSMLANLRWEDRPDRTPIALYNTPGGTQNGYNEPRSIRSLVGKAEASYSLPYGFRFTGGYDYDQRNRNFSPVRVVSGREQTEERTWRVELRRSMSDTITGAVAYLHSDRDGSPFLTTFANNGTFGANLIAPVSMSDRKRDKYRVSMNWDPLEQLSLQFMADHARDKYESRTFLGKGVSNGKAENFGVDATYTFSPNLNVTAWYSRNDTRSDQATCATLTVIAATGAMTCPASQMANLSNVNDSVGLGLRGKPRERWETGADFSFSEIGDKYKQAALTGAAVTSLPDVATRISSAKMFVKYDVKKNAAIRLNYTYDRISTNDWTWINFVYSDGTKVYRDPNQHVQFVGLTYIYKWQ